MDLMTFFYIQNTDSTYTINGYDSGDLTTLKMTQSINSFDGTVFTTTDECGAWLANFYSPLETLSPTSCCTYDPSTVPPVTPTDLPTVIATAIANMQADFAIASYETFTSVAFDGITLQTYACDATSQAQIMAEASIAALVKLGYSSEVISWKNVNQDLCVVWVPQNMIDLVSSLHNFMTVQTDYLERLCIYINGLTDINLISTVTYGMTIPS
jgi:hypothetical protein